MLGFLVIANAFQHLFFNTVSCVLTVFLTSKVISEQHWITSSDFFYITGNVKYVTS